MERKPTEGGPGPGSSGEGGLGQAGDSKAKGGGEDESGGAAGPRSGGKKENLRAGPSDGVNTGFRRAAPWMLIRRNLVAELGPGDCFGEEGVWNEEGALCMHTVVSAGEVELLAVPVTKWFSHFPKKVQQAMGWGYSARAKWRWNRSAVMDQEVPQVSKDFELRTRHLCRLDKSGADSKTTLKRPHELEYKVWREPSRDLVREARIEELCHDPLQRKEVRKNRLQKLHRTFNMESSICLQTSPMDLLRPSTSGQLRMQYSVGFMHSCPKRQQKPRDLKDDSKDMLVSSIAREHRRARTAPAAAAARFEEKGLGATSPVSTSRGGPVPPTIPTSLHPTIPPKSLHHHISTSHHLIHAS